MSRVTAGARAPEVFTLEIANAPGASEPLDLLDVSAVVFEVIPPRGPARTWAATIISQTSAELVARHTWARGDVETAGDYKIMVEMTVSGGTRRAGWTAITVVAP